MDAWKIFDSIREFIGSIANKVFLWSICMTQDEYISTVYEQERVAEGVSSKMQPVVSLSEQPPQADVCERPNGQEKGEEDVVH